MDIFINLPYPQYIKAVYAINWGGSYACSLAARLIIDGKEERGFRCHNAALQWPQVHRYGEVYLSAGQHQIVVEYRNSCDGVMNPFATEWALAYFKLSYYQLVPSS